MKRNKVVYRKMAVTVLTAIFLFALYCIIFGFSAQDGEQSSGLSEKVTIVIVETASDIYFDFSQDMIAYLCKALEPVVRKTAHFSEYLLLGAGWYLLFSQWIKNRGLFALICVVISAVLDEFHQTFVPGRDGNIIDVGIDSAGGLTGILILALLLRLVVKLLEKRKKGDNRDRSI